VRGGLPAASAGESGSTFATFQSPLGGGRRAGTRASGQAGQAEHCVVAAALAGVEPQDSATRAYALAVSHEIDTQEHLLGRQHGAQHARQLQFFTQLRFTPTCCAQGSRLGLAFVMGCVLPRLLALARSRVRSPSSPGCGSACLRWHNGVHHAFASDRSCGHAVQRAALLGRVRSCVLTDSVHFRPPLSRAMPQWLLALSCCSVDMGALVLRWTPSSSNSSQCVCPGGRANLGFFVTDLKSSKMPLPVGSKTMTEHPGFRLREKWRGVVHEPAAAPRRSERGGWGEAGQRGPRSRLTMHSPQSEPLKTLGRIRQEVCGFHLRGMWRGVSGARGSGLRV
jgi:hypothetical protein